MELLANTDYMIEMEDNKRLLQEDVIFSVKSVNSFTTVQHFVDEARLNERIITLPDRLCKSDRIKVEYILNKVNDALGAANLSMDTDRHHRYKIYLYLAATRKVVGCLVAESINTAFRVISVDTDNNNDNNNLDDSLIYKSNTPVTCLCGISRIWVDKTMRRQGVATRLLDAARRTFVYACTLDYDQIAFSQPTLLGRRLAMNYQKDANFLVYSENI
ncbi:ESCO1/2 acetyl-transferase-domain-containing protein [Syncephalis plumigaleata]|nr:ESCO1/2 acetyl-transferase-domain-containing protein [Syncephalis plumigaleata]